MKQITISNETLGKIRGHAILPFVETGTNNGDGTSTIPLDDDLFERIGQTAAAAGLSMEDMILRMMQGPAQ